MPGRWRAPRDGRTGWVGGLRANGGTGPAGPGRLAWGLRRACLEAGVRIFEGTPVVSLTPPGAGMTLTTPYGSADRRDMWLRLLDRLGLGFDS
ncbi:FAD-dependent oxidoreductase [Trebonia sp.]|uniref:FAD-dependent oxidoreductase n=1 Tax=Trebonia sp. TaxID=2767075 RepID=UPI002622FA76|nr:FAD-dependent oxidoreductase [Trebonia sp.]